MRLVSIPLTGSAVAGLLSVAAAMLSWPWGQALCHVVALGLLIVHIVWSGGPPAPPLRWALVAGVALLAAATAVRLLLVGGQPTYATLPPYAAAGDPRDVVLQQWRYDVAADRVAMLCLLSGVACLAGTVLSLPRRHRSPRTVLCAALALSVLIPVGANLRGPVADRGVPALLEATWPAVLATLAAIAAAVLAARRGSSGWLVPTGALLLAVATAMTLAEHADRWSAWSAFSVLRQARGVAISAALTWSVSVPLDLSAALLAAAAIGGPVLIAVSVSPTASTD